MFISPIAIAVDMNIDVMDYIFFRCGVIVLFMASLWDKPRREMPQEIRLIILGLLGLCLANLFIHSFAQIILAPTMNIFLAALAFYIVYCYLDEKANLVKYILFAGLINLAFFIGQVFEFDPVFDKLADDGGAFFGNVPRFANYATLLLPFLGLPLALIIGLVLLWITKQFVFLIPLAWMLFVKIKPLRQRILLMAAILLLLVLGWPHIRHSLIDTRYTTLWYPALKAFFDRPLIGYGLGVNVVSDVGSIFNNFLQFMLGVGIFGLAWFAYVFRCLRKSLSLNNRSIPLLTLMGMMCIEYPLEIPRLWYLVMAIIVMFLIKPEENYGVH